MQEGWSQGLITCSDIPKLHDCPERSVSAYLTKEFWRPPSRRRYIASRSLIPSPPLRLSAHDLRDALERGTVLAGAPVQKTIVTPHATIFVFGKTL